MTLLDGCKALEAGVDDDGCSDMFPPEQDTRLEQIGMNVCMGHDQ